MNIKNIGLYIMMTLIAVMFYSCSAENGGTSKIVTTVIFIVLFLGASLCSAVLTFKLRRKKNADSNENDLLKKNEE